LNGFNSFISFKRSLSQDEEQKLYTSIEKSVKNCKNQQKIQKIDLHGDKKENFTLLSGEKSEIIGIFEVMKNISNETFLSKTRSSDIEKIMLEVKSRIQLEPSFMDEIRKVLNPTHLPLFLKLMNDVSLTYEKSSKTNQYPDNFKKFCTYLYVKMGKQAYKTLQLNSTMPSITTVKNEIISNYKGLKLGKIYGMELRAFLDRNSLPLSVCVCEDATRVMSSMQFDSKSGELLGLVLDYSSRTGLPNHLDQVVKTPEDIFRLVKNQQRAKFIEVIMARPMTKGMTVDNQVYIASK
jgi:hypothetical protein